MRESLGGESCKNLDSNNEAVTDSPVTPKGNAADKERIENAGENPPITKKEANDVVTEAKGLSTVTPQSSSK